MSVIASKRSTGKMLAWPLFIAFLVLVLSTAFYASLLLYSSSVNERSSRIYKQSLVASIKQYEYLPDLLAADTAIQRSVLASTENAQDSVEHYLATYDELNKRLQFTTQRSGAGVTYLMNIDGTVVASSNYDDPSSSFVGKNYSFRPYFKKAILERARQFYYAKGATTGIPGFFIAAPILANNDVVGVAVVKLELQQWEKNWQDSGEDIIVTDANGVVILSAREEWRYRSTSTLSEHTLQSINQQKQFKGSSLLPLATKYINLNYADNSPKAYWVIDGKIYLVNQFFIKDTHWNLYYLVKHDEILNYSIIFFMVAGILAMMFFLMLRERRHKLKSQQKNRDLEVKRREELQKVMDNIHIGVVIFSKDGLLLSVNGHAKYLLLKGEELTGDVPVYIHQLINTEAFDKDFNTLLLEDIAMPAYHETYTVGDQSQATPVMFSISKLEAMGESVYLMTVINIARRKMAENKLIQINECLEETVNNRTKELRDAQAELIQKNKVAALGNMAATIVHEISQPLTAINSSVAAANAKARKEDWQGAVDSINRLAPLSQKMLDIIKLLKFFSYQDEESKNAVNVCDLVLRSVDGFKDTLSEKNIVLDIAGNQQALYINVNAIKMDLVISNIIKNAVDAVDTIPQPKISISIDRQAEHARITVKDNGKGVDSAILQQLFTPYFTTKEVGRGLGLGLSISHEIIQEYGGNIAIDNSSQGANFTVIIPLCKQPSADIHRYG